MASRRPWHTAGIKASLCWCDDERLGSGGRMEVRLLIADRKTPDHPVTLAQADPAVDKKWPRFG
jgi:hypothetical protein